LFAVLFSENPDLDRRLADDAAPSPHRDGYGFAVNGGGSLPQTLADHELSASRRPALELVAAMLQILDRREARLQAAAFGVEIEPVWV